MTPTGIRIPMAACDECGMDGGHILSEVVVDLVHRLRVRWHAVLTTAWPAVPPEIPRAGASRAPSLPGV